MTDGQSPEASPQSEPDMRKDDKSTVLELFGIELKVSNPRLAELLTMDAREALSTDVKLLSDGDAVRRQKAELREAAPDAVVAATTPRDSREAQERTALRSRVDALGVALGFEVGADSVWASPTSLSISVRALSGAVSYAAASDMVGKLEAHRASLSGSDEGALFVVESQQTVEVFKVAIRQGHHYGNMRCISTANLERVRGLFGAGALDHQAVVSLLLPVADIDVGELLTICNEAASSTD